jgi:hypothetical protein
VSSKFGLAITVALAALAAVVGGAILITSGRASEVNLTTASLVPEDAGAYFALNTDLSSGQWVNTFRLAERLGADDPKNELKDGASSAELDWEDDVAPFLGGNAAVFVRGLSISDISAQGAVILRCKDSKRALKVIEEQGGKGEEGEYGGVEYFQTEAEDGFVARIDEHLVIAFDEDSLHAVIDVHNGKTRSLASTDGFKRLRDELTGNFLAFVYLDTENLVGDFILDDPVVKAALEESGAGDAAFKPAGWVIGAKKDGFEFQAASIADSGVVGPMIAPRKSNLVKYVPADAAIFFSTVDIAKTWDAVLKDAGPKIDEAVREQSDYDDLDDAMRAAGEQLGIRSLEDVIQLLNGETALAAWFPDGDQDHPEGVLLAEVDQAKAKDLLTKMANSSPQGSRTQTVAGTEMTVFRDEGGEEGAFAFKDGNLLLGTKAAVVKVLENTDPPLGSLKRYTQTIDEMPTSLGTYAFLNMSTILRLAEGGVPADLDEAERALSGLIINVVDERGVFRLSGILTVED